jgi:hypothetical protein
MTDLLANMCFIAGCGKCGTTTLSYLLNSHPDIILSSPKESNFYSRDSEYIKGLDYYQSLFRDKNSAKIRLDASVSYTLFDTEQKVVERVKQTCIEPKFIYIARSPYRRLESVFSEAHASTHISKINMPYDLKSAIRYYLPMVFNSLYWERTEAIRNNFPATDVLYLTLEDLASDQKGTLKRCFDFLKITGELSGNDAVQLNKSTSKTYEPVFLRKTRNFFETFNFLPQSSLDFLQRKLRRPINELDFSWDEEAKYFIEIVFREDVRNYLKTAGKPASFWGEEFL